MRCTHDDPPYVLSFPIEVQRPARPLAGREVYEYALGRVTLLQCPQCGRIGVRGVQETGGDEAVVWAQ